MSLIKSSQIEQPVNFSGSFTGSLLGTASWAENIDTGSLVTTSSFNTFTSSYYIDSASFDYRIENIVVNTGSYDTPPVTVNVATTAVLPRSPLYNNGPLNDGVNAFLSASISGTLGNIDGVTVVMGDHILVKNQSNAIQNGVYNVISTGSASGYYILSRSLSSDETSELDSQIVIPSFGTTNKGGIFAQTTDNPIIGTDNIVYAQQTNTLVTQTSAGTQAVYQLPWYTTSTRQLSKGSKNFKYINVTVGTTVTTSSLQLTGSFNISGSIISVGGITGSLLGTASYSLQSLSSSYVPISRSFGITIDGAGSAISTGIKTDVVIPFNMNINSWTLVADQTGSIVIDVWKDTYSNYPPTVSKSIAGSEKPTLSASLKNQDLSLSTWTSSISSGDIVRFNVDSISSITKVTLIINGIS